MELNPAGPAPRTLAGTALTLIHAGLAPTRSALTDRLGVTRATVGAITGELRDLGLIVVGTGPQGGEPSGRAGRRTGCCLTRPARSRWPPRCTRTASPWRLSGSAGVVVARHDERVPVPADPGRALAPVAAAAAGLLRASGRRCVGAAVAVPAAVTRPEGRAVRSLYTGWPDGAPVRDLFAAELARRGVPGPGAAARLACEAVNDVNAIALAEHRHGAGRDATHLLVVVAEHRGVGGALVLGGALYTGSTGLAMEAGHVSVDPGGRLCPCGNRGCLNVETDVARFLAADGRVPAPDGVPCSTRPSPCCAPGTPPTGGYARPPTRSSPRLGLGLAGPDQRGQPGPGAARRPARAPAARRARPAARGRRPGQPLGLRRADPGRALRP